jgi:hypothetical protein
VICLLSPTKEEAEKFARAQFLARNEYFWAGDKDNLVGRVGFHVLVVGFFENTRYFENLLAYAQANGSRNRK